MLVWIDLCGDIVTCSVMVVVEHLLSHLAAITNVHVRADTVGVGGIRICPVPTDTP